jgi:hypothetical protein
MVVTYCKLSVYYTSCIYKKKIIYEKTHEKQWKSYKSYNISCENVKTFEMWTQHKQ